MNIAGQHIGSLSMFLFAVAVFFVTGVVVFVRQGVKFLAVVAFIAAALALTAGVLRL
ncbi:hypothetical protein [Actinomadura alba]|uniref:Uncharacterized protein n=1 Tax=Actinomadura alba TaxID=406431 RepID=A0ABR7LLH6_9ACTN|nr:hypothetical protein [Actinomadura alba]MBC6465585.1 hypothetical protein [Actinomadura alba]